ENQEISFRSISQNREARLRLGIFAASKDTVLGAAVFKIQFAATDYNAVPNSPNWKPAIACNQIPDNKFQDLGTSGPVRFLDNPNATHGAVYVPSINDPFYGTAIPQTYLENNPLANSNARIPANYPAIWDFALKIQEVPQNQLICFRIIKQNGGLLDNYEIWPAIYN
ncbi:MAG: hypothetical protein AAB885_00795, partial [Patescibacteria group bacterium]